MESLPHLRTYKYEAKQALSLTQLLTYNSLYFSQMFLLLRLNELTNLKSDETYTVSNQIIYKFVF